MKRKLPLLLWITGTIFPLNWLRQESALIRRHFDSIFSPERVHIIGHLLIFSTLAVLFLRTNRWPLNRNAVIWLLGLILMSGGLQELLQLPTKGRALGAPEIFDLCVDMVGGILGLFFFLIYKWVWYSPHHGQRQTKNVTSHRTEDNHQDSVTNRSFVSQDSPGYHNALDG